MMETTELMQRLAAEARPVRVMHRPLLRAGCWLVIAAALIVLLAVGHGVRPDIAERIGDPSFVVCTAASLLTGALAAIGCLVASLPDRSRTWLLLPLPPLAAWVASIGYGCLTDWVSFDADGVRVGEALRCLATLLLVSLPLSAAIFVMLRHAARLRPTLVTMTAGLAVAGMTATAMSLLHQVDASIMILLWNIGMAGLIVAIESVLGRRILARMQVTALR